MDSILAELKEQNNDLRQRVEELELQLAAYNHNKPNPKLGKLNYDHLIREKDREIERLKHELHQSRKKE